MSSRHTLAGSLTLGYGFGFGYVWIGTTILMISFNLPGSRESLVLSS